jgi:hypothetical protein
LKKNNLIKINIFDLLNENSKYEFSIGLCSVLAIGLIILSPFVLMYGLLFGLKIILRKWLEIK